MSERTPLNPWGGSVNHFPIPEKCSRSATESILFHVAGKIGLGIKFLPNDTPEDKKLIAAIIGVNKTEDEEAVELLEKLANNELVPEDEIGVPTGNLKTKVSMGMPGVVFLARLPVEEGSDARPNYELLSDKIDELRTTTSQLLTRVN